MERHRSLRTRVVLPLVSMGLGAIGAVACASTRGEPSQADATATSFCIDGSVEQDQSTLVSSLKAAEHGALGKADGVAATDQKSKSNPLVFAANCPDGFVLPDEPTDGSTLPADSVKSQAVAEASPYNVKIFIVDKDAPVLRGSEWKRLPYERKCEPEGHPCAEVSTAIYVSSLKINDPVFAERIILEGLGVRGAVEYPSGHMPQDDKATKPTPEANADSSHR